MNTQLRIVILFCVMLIGNWTMLAQEQPPKVMHDFELEINSEYRLFFKNGQFDKQAQHFPSLAFTPKYTAEWNDGYESINFTGFFRLDRDDQRTHWDIRELYYQKVKNKWEWNVGLKKVFWGVTESNHLVDIINQTDQVESFDGEAKLGQPMLQATLATDKVGTFDFFYLPYHRKRVFAGDRGRFRFPLVLPKNAIDYESSAEEWYPSFALRWSHYFNIVDIGVSQFVGNGREPVFSFNAEGEINAFYPKISQTGLDLQITHSAFLWKLESIYRYAEIQDFFALTAGVEYTFSNINGKGLDIGILAEYLYDSRDELTISALENDLFIGSRIALNDPHDSSFLIGAIKDLNSTSTIFSVEASRRIGERFTTAIEARIFHNIDEDELLLSNFRDDSFLRLEVAIHF